MTKSIVCLQPLTSQQQERIKAAAPGYTFTQGDAKNPDLQLLAEAEIVIGWAKGISDTLLRPESSLRWVQSWSAGIEKLPSIVLNNKESCSPVGAEFMPNLFLR